MDNQVHASAHIYVHHAHIKYKCTDEREREMSNGRDKTSINVPKDYARTRRQGLKREILSFVQFMKLNKN